MRDDASSIGIPIYCFQCNISNADVDFARLLNNWISIVAVFFALTTIIHQSRYWRNFAVRIINYKNHLFIPGRNSPI